MPERVSTPELDRNLAFLAYGLMFFAPFFAGAPALIAVAIAQARRETAEPLIRRHHRYQIWVFWIGFGLALLAGGAALAFLVSAAFQVFRAASDDDGIRSFDDLLTEIGDSHTMLLFFVSMLALAAISALWLSGASAYGFFRLASGKPIVQSREP